MQELAVAMGRHQKLKREAEERCKKAGQERLEGENYTRLALETKRW